MDTNFHTLVFIFTLVVYIILRSYKKLNTDDSKSSNLIYVLLVPVILYSGNYYFNITKLNKKDTLRVSGSMSEDLLSIPYPVSSDSLS